MSEYSTAYHVACSPGPNAAVAMTRVPGGAPVLVIYFDPVNMVIQTPPSERGTRMLADFCRELAREASLLAHSIDPDGELPEPEVTWPRHALVRDEFGDTGVGH